jgi:hypothetical protein
VRFGGLELWLGGLTVRFYGFAVLWSMGFKFYGFHCLMVSWPRGVVVYDH